MRRRVFAWVAVVAFTYVVAFAVCIFQCYAPVPVFATASGMKVVIDAGHGGIDGGVTGVRTGVKESDLNLQIAYLLKDTLEETGFEVMLTRKSAEGLYGTAASGFKRRDMLMRKELIERATPDFVLSIHQNRFSSRATRGAQVFYNKDSADGQRLASCLQDRLNALYQEKGVRARKEMQGEYFILQCVPVPSVIVECGFLSNSDDEALLMSTAWQRRLCESILQGFLHYFTPSVS